jgi:hypothetical protein
MVRLQKLRESQGTKGETVKKEKGQEVHAGSQTEQTLDER